MLQIRRTSCFFVTLIAFLSLFYIDASQSAWYGEVRDSNTSQAILKRIKPIGQVTIEGAAAVAATAAINPADIGKHRYETTCKACHGTGVAGAPKFKSAADWKSRMSVGINGMLAIAIKGKGGMPPRGTCMSCTDDELKSAIEYMLPK
jgi:cytochrome c5